MGNAAGLRRDFNALEQRRLRAARWLESGVSQSEVARRTGVHRQSVSRWAQQLATEGRVGLKKAGRAGRKPRLSVDDLKRIEDGLKRGPESLGYNTALWTSVRVAHLIEQECSIEYHPGHVWRILRQLGWSWSATDGSGAGTCWCQGFGTSEAPSTASHIQLLPAAARECRGRHLSRG